MMNEGMFAQIERRLSVTLPEGYCEPLLEAPPLRDSETVWYRVYTEPDAIVSVTLNARRETVGGAPWPDEFIVVGHDQADHLYVVDCGDGEAPVYIAGPADGNPEEIALEPEAANFREFLEKVDAFECEFRVAEANLAERERNRKWWQFWKY